MRKQTAPRTPKHQQVSPAQQAGLIAGKQNAPQSGTPRSALDNRSHRTACSCAASDPPACGSAARAWRRAPQAHKYKFLQSVRARQHQLRVRQQSIPWQIGPRRTQDQEHKCLVLV